MPEMWYGYGRAIAQAVTHPPSRHKIDHKSRYLETVVDNVAGMGEGETLSEYNLISHARSQTASVV
jgi:hypothetical protein